VNIVPAQRCKLVFNAIFNAMRTLPDLTRIYLYQSFIKTAINTAITVKLLHLKWHYWILAKSWKWLMKNNLNWSWEYKVKGQWDLLLCSLVNVKRMRKRNGTDPRSGCGIDMGIKCGTDMGIKCVFLMIFFASFLRFCLFYLCFFVMDATSY
jgi:hypothetical protein